MTAIDFPAAHSMDTAWFAVDSQGRVANFETDENGAVPGSWLGGVDTAYDIADLLFARDLRARFLRGEVTGHVGTSSAFILTSDPSALLELDPTSRVSLVVAGSPAVVLMDGVRVPFEHIPGVLASVAEPRDLELSTLGIYQYEHDGVPGSYVCTGVPSSPIQLDALPLATRDVLTHVTLDAKFGEPFQLADHTKDANYWSAGSESLWGGPPEDDVPEAPHSILSSLLDLGGSEDDALTRNVSTNDLVVPAVTTLLATEGRAADDDPEWSDIIAFHVGHLIGEQARVVSPRVPNDGEEENLTTRLNAILHCVARRRDAELPLAMACRFVSAQPHVSRDKLARTLRVDLRTALAQDALRQKGHPLALVTVYYAAKEHRVVLASDVLGDGVLYREAASEALVRGPMKELLAMLDDPHFTHATDAVMSAPTALYR